MKFFVDTAELDEIKALLSSNLIDGVTTNPSLIAKSGKNIKDTISNICKIVKGPVSAEVTSTETEGMIEEGKVLYSIASNVIVKLPLTWNGLEACNRLSNEKIPTNVTLCFSAAQALLAAKAGATYVSPFIGRLDDSGIDGVELISQIRVIYDNYQDLDTKILAASIRNTNHVIQVSMLGADVATVPPKILKDLVKHPLTDIGLENFLSDWQKTGQKIN
ncbi:MAG: fructose-6-phosphate aldolase [Alphaproteobacteria bacterium]|uniref:Probable transaldolase n=1 Tax=PS1 clade bacterium TaxID=2175152 RepID=A0A368DTG4_9PROT|nr:fructose-6-phosphate aldolase [Rhodobiaceae bacterium]MBH20457.1 fructose-6-phosphate aldolase [Rhodobiaceae bacterium]OUT74812.1 MAG: fructose-6-phosphate aldolase [Rhizobiales bacterium TMED25]RCL74606.1 MAG: fructose-6-phosphate aldolase [PS1 clade bacterium]